MTVSVLELATDWTGQTYEERLRLCAETLFAHHLINPRTFGTALNQIRARAEIQRERAAGGKVSA